MENQDFFMLARVSDSVHGKSSSKISLPAQQEEQNVIVAVAAAGRHLARTAARTTARGRLSNKRHYALQRNVSRPESRALQRD
jgi:hypothetical protein